MTYDQISLPMRAFLGTFLTIRTLGYPASSIFLCWYPNAWALRLDHLGKQFTIALGFWKTDQQETMAEYARVTVAVATIGTKEGGIPEEDCARMVAECEARQRLSQLMIAMVQNGFRVPLPQEN